MISKNKIAINDKIAVTLAILAFIIFLGIAIFSAAETFRHFTILSSEEEVNVYGIPLFLLMFGIWASNKDFYLCATVFVFTFFVFLVSTFIHYQEIDERQYKKIENVDKSIIEKFVNGKNYVNGWDYLNILENKHIEANQKNVYESQKHIEEVKNKVFK